LTLPNSAGRFDLPWGFSTGAADLFVPPAVYGSALRTAAEKNPPAKPLTELNFTEVRQVQGLKEATIKAGRRLAET